MDEMLKRFLTYLKVEKGYSDETISNYGEDLRAFEAYYFSLEGEMTWADVDRNVVRGWMMHMMEKGNKPTSVNRRLSAVRTFYKYLMLVGAIQSNPAYGVKGPKKNKPLPAFVKESEMNRLLDDVEFADTPEGQRDRAILLTFYLTGMRVSELLALNVGDVDFGNHRIRVTGKRNKQRFVPFVGELADVLHAVAGGRRDSEALFVDDEGERMSRYKVEKVVRSYLSMVTTLTKRSPHVLRHTFATAMLNGEAGLEVVKEILGHESIATTEVYTHTTFEELKKNYKKAHPRA